MPALLKTPWTHRPIESFGRAISVCSTLADTAMVPIHLMGHVGLGRSLQGGFRHRITAGLPHRSPTGVLSSEQSRRGGSRPTSAGRRVPEPVFQGTGIGRVVLPVTR
jgi:hypothetical protein